jgi:hypothetical protein
VVDGGRPFDPDDLADSFLHDLPVEEVPGGRLVALGRPVALVDRSLAG